MPETTIPAEAPTRPRRNFFSFGFALLYLVLASIVAMAVLPPLLNVNRFKRRIVTSISSSLGRPVHLDSVTLVLLPFPGFKLTNFVVAEDAAFGAEPVIHANEVVAILRVPSLYSKKVEFSRISLKEPSINLVHNASGAWNLESILLKAEQISAAPTAQATAGPDPRFPYIEATDARVNIKSGLEKLPFSLTEADFALWLPQPSQWRIRVSGKPTRTDTSASDTGTVSLDGTLSRAATFNLIPIDLAAEWKNAPLGEASRVLTGQDAGVRGELRLNVSVRGTVESNVLKTSLDLRGLRRADFLPDRPINLRADCQATTAQTFHALHAIRCSWPPPGEPTLLALTGDLPSIHDPASASFQIGTPGLPAATLIQWLRAASPRIAPDITATGTLTGSLSRETHPDTKSPGAPSIALLPYAMGGTYDLPAPGSRTKSSGAPSIALLPHAMGGTYDLPAPGSRTKSPGAPSIALLPHAMGGTYDSPAPGSRTKSPSAPSIALLPHAMGGTYDSPALSGSLTLAGVTLSGGPLHGTPITLSDTAITAVSPKVGLVLAPTILTLGGKEPATLEGHFDPTGYSLHLTGSALPSRLLALGTAIPQIGDGLSTLFLPPSAPQPTASKEVPIHLDLTSQRQWTGGQTWSRTTPAKLPRLKHHRR